MKQMTISRLTALAFGAFLLGATACGGGGGMEGCGAQTPEKPPLDCPNGTYEQNGKCVKMTSQQKKEVQQGNTTSKNGSSTSSSSSNHP